jgi:hypothetical protein
MKKVKQIFVFILSLIVFSGSLKLKNYCILLLLRTSFTATEFVKFIEQILNAFDLTSWLLFITISLPYKVNKTSIVLVVLFVLLSFPGSFDPKVLFNFICGIIGLIFYHRIANKFNFTKKIKNDSIVDMDTDKIIWQTAFYTFVFSCVFTISVLASVFSLSMLIKAPIWTILIVLPLTEFLFWTIIIVIFNIFGNYLVDSFNVHPALFRSLFITTIISTITIVIFFFVILPMPFSPGTSFFRGMANGAIVFFAIRVFTVSIFQFQNHISRNFQSAFAKNFKEFSFDDTKYSIDNDSIAILQERKKEKKKLTYRFYFGIFIVIFPITAIITHIWTVIIAFTESGFFGGILTLFLPFLAEIYWIFKMFGENNTYAYIALTHLVLSILWRDSYLREKERNKRLFGGSKVE